MIVETYQCDNISMCSNTTPKARPGPQWKVILWLSSYVAKSPMNDSREQHFCSIECLRASILTTSNHR